LTVSYVVTFIPGLPRPLALPDVIDDVMGLSTFPSRHSVRKVRGAPDRIDVIVPVDDIAGGLDDAAQAAEEITRIGESLLGLGFVLDERSVRVDGLDHGWLPEAFGAGGREREGSVWLGDDDGLLGDDRGVEGLLGGEPGDEPGWSDEASASFRTDGVAGDLGLFGLGGRRGGDERGGPRPDEPLPAAGALRGAVLRGHGPLRRGGGGVPEDGRRRARRGAAPPALQRTLRWPVGLLTAAVVAVLAPWYLPITTASIVVAALVTAVLGVTTVLCWSPTQTRAARMLLTGAATLVLVLAFATAYAVCARSGEVRRTVVAHVATSPASNAKVTTTPRITTFGQALSASASLGAAPGLMLTGGALRVAYLQRLLLLALLATALVQSAITAPRAVREARIARLGVDEGLRRTEAVEVALSDEREG
jgi:hypothetical protein